MTNLILRKLNPEENIRARALYEEVFPEDDEQFVNYYFDWKIRDNVIYAAENEDGIQATVHLNPFLVYLSGEVQRMHYIVAVATRKEYRHQGLMRRLLAMAEQDMQQAGEKFTFLMPADENIYLPFGYRYFAWQRRGFLCTGGTGCGKTEADGMVDVENCGWLCRPVKPLEYQQLADFVNTELKKQYDMFIWRDAAYYERLCAEQQCQGGDVMVICRSEKNGQQPENLATANGRDLCEAGEEKEQFLGTFCTAYEAEDSEQKAVVSPLVLREIIFDTTQFAVAEEALLSYINTYAVANISIDAVENRIAGINTDANACIGKTVFRAEGCPKDLILHNESWHPLLMGKIPGQVGPGKIREKEAVFINEVV